MKFGFGIGPDGPGSFLCRDIMSHVFSRRRSMQYDAAYKFIVIIIIKNTKKELIE